MIKFDFLSRNDSPRCGLCARESEQGNPGQVFNGVSFHGSSMRRLFMVVFPSEPVLLAAAFVLLCFVFVLDIGKNAFPVQISRAKDPLMMPCPTKPLPDA